MDVRPWKAWKDWPSNHGLKRQVLGGGRTPTLRVFDGRDLLGFVLVVELKTFFIFTPIWREIIQLDEDDIFQLEFS